MAQFILILANLFFFLAISLSMWDLSSPTRDQTHIPCIGNMSLIHWTIREVPRTIFLKLRSDSSTPQFKAGQWFLLLSRTKSQTLKCTLVLASTQLFSHLCPTTQPFCLQLLSQGLSCPCLCLTWKSLPPSSLWFLLSFRFQLGCPFWRGGSPPPHPRPPHSNALPAHSEVAPHHK